MWYQLCLRSQHCWKGRWLRYNPTTKKKLVLLKRKPGASWKNWWFVAITNDYVCGLLGSSGILLHQWQRVIDVGTQAVTARHDVMTQFCPATKRTGMYHYIILNAWVMSGTLPGTHTKKQEGTQVHKNVWHTWLLPLFLLITMTNLKVYCGQSHH